MNFFLGSSKKLLVYSYTVVSVNICKITYRLLDPFVNIEKIAQILRVCAQVCQTAVKNQKISIFLRTTPARARSVSDMTKSNATLQHIFLSQHGIKCTPVPVG